jgi:hypothetical protein
MIPPIKRCGGCEGTLLGLRITIGNKLQILIYIYMKCLWIALKKKNLNFFENSKNTTFEFWVQSLKHEYGVRRSWVGTMEMMHATQNEEQLCPNPNLKCTREWVGFGRSELAPMLNSWLGMRIKLSRMWEEDPTAIDSSLCGWLWWRWRWGVGDKL